MIKLLPVTALHYNLPTNPNDHYNLPTNPNELDVYIEMDDETAKKLSSPGCDGLTFDDVTGLSSRILHQLVRNHFNDPRQDAEYQWFLINQTPTIIADYKHHYALNVTDFFTGDFERKTLTTVYLSLMRLFVKNSLIKENLSL